MINHHSKTCSKQSIHHLKDKKEIKEFNNNSNQRKLHSYLLANKTKSILIEGLCENVRQLKVGIYKLKNNIPSLSMITNKMMFYLNMFCPRVLNWIFSKIYRTGVVTFYWDERELKIKIFQLLFHPQYLCTTIAHGNILGFRS